MFTFINEESLFNGLVEENTLSMVSIAGKIYVETEKDFPEAKYINGAFYVPENTFYSEIRKQTKDIIRMLKL